MADTTVASYNVHGFVGADGRQDVGRVVAVLDEIDADLVALQEAVSPGGDRRSLELALLGATRHRKVVAGVTVDHGSEQYGNALLTRLEIRQVRLHDLSVRRFEPRGAIDVDVDVGAPDGLPLRLIATHLGLRRSERKAQAGRLAEVVGPAGGPAAPTVLIGDLNEWWPFGGPLARLRRVLDATPAHRTFPSRRPTLPLDRCFLRPRTMLRSISVHDSELARTASDHLPLVVRLEMPVAGIGRAATTR